MKRELHRTSCPFAGGRRSVGAGGGVARSSRPAAAPTERRPPRPCLRSSSVDRFKFGTSSTGGHRMPGEGFLVETGVPVDDLWRVPAAARRIEALGYSGAIAPETTRDPFLPLAIAAEHTTRLGLGTSVAIAFPRAPMVVAQVAWDLQRFSKGRFALGLGSQVRKHNEERFSVRWTAPVARMREYIQTLRAIWESWQHGTKPAFVGEHYRYTYMTPFFNPGPIEHPRIPVAISAV